MNTELVGELNIATQLQGGQLNALSQLRGGMLTLPTILDGVGIESIVFNDDGTMTIVLTDGTTYTSPCLIGPGLPPGGTTGQVPTKVSDDDYAIEWADQTGTELVPATVSTLGGIIVGSDLSITDNGVLSVDKATEVSEDNTKPITAAAVYTEIGNINAALATI